MAKLSRLPEAGELTGCFASCGSRDCQPKFLARRSHMNTESAFRAPFTSPNWEPRFACASPKAMGLNRMQRIIGRTQSNSRQSTIFLFAVGDLETASAPRGARQKNA